MDPGFRRDDDVRGFRASDGMSRFGVLKRKTRPGD